MVKKPKYPKPDEEYSIGPLQFARFDKLLVSRNNMTKEEHSEFIKEMAERYPLVCNEINAIISNVTAKIQKMDPKKVLHRAYWEMAANHMGMMTESEVGHDEALSMRMLDYCHAIIASTPKAQFEEGEIDDNDWADLNEQVEALFNKLNIEFHMCRSAFERNNDPEYDADKDDFYTRSVFYWCNVRGHRYLVNEIAHFTDLITPHNDILIELFDVSADQLLESLESILNSLTRGINDVTQDFEKFQKTTMEAFGRKIETLKSKMDIEPAEIMEAVIKENGWKDWQVDIFGKMFGFKLFDLQELTDLPESLLDELAWEAGQDADFFSEGEYRGWPLRVWPNFKRPFIKLEGKFYCFDAHCLFDHLYRALQKIILRLRPDYSELWNSKQKEISEEIPIKLMSTLLPDATILKSIYYQWPTGERKQLNWCEADAVLVFEGHIFVIEVKGGAFTHTPPATDFPAYIRSVENLIFKPAMQGERFLDYLESNDEVAIYEKKGKNFVEIGKLRGSEFHHKQICTVTLDPFTEIAAKGQSLGKLGHDFGERNIWSFSIDDLRVYSEIFKNPLIFLHYTEQRMRAFVDDKIQTEDELDFVGLYLKHNNYSQYASEVFPDGEIGWHGYRDEVDNFFAEKMYDPSHEWSVGQILPARLDEIITLLSKGTLKGRCRVTSALLDADEDARQSIAKYIDEIFEIQRKAARVQPLYLQGEGANITIFCWQDGFLGRDSKVALEYAKAALLGTDYDDRLLIELTFDRGEILKDISFNFLKRSDISIFERPHLAKQAEELKARRIKSAINKSGKIGVNEKCPCGSGKKYKKCCKE